MITASTDVSEAGNEAPTSHFTVALLPAGGAKEPICLFQLQFMLVPKPSCSLQTLQSLFHSVSSALSITACHTDRRCDVFLKMTFSHLYYIYSLHCCMQFRLSWFDEWISFLSAVQCITLSGHLYSFSAQLMCISSLIVNDKLMSVLNLATLVQHLFMWPLLVKLNYCIMPFSPGILKSVWSWEAINSALTLIYWC